MPFSRSHSTALVHVAVGGGQRLLAIHHAHAGHFAQVLYISCGKSHFEFLQTDLVSSEKWRADHSASAEAVSSAAALLGLFALLALQHGVGHDGRDQLDGADGVRRCRGSHSRSRRDRSWCRRWPPRGCPACGPSAMALRSLRVSTMNRAPGSFFMSFTPPRYFSSLAISPRCFMTSFLGSMSKVAVGLHGLQLVQPGPRGWRMVLKLVIMPPSHRAFT